MYAGDSGNPTAAICTRHESRRRCGESGWLHWLQSDPRGRPRTQQRRVVLLQGPTAADTVRQDIAQQAEEARQAIAPDALQRLADTLGLSPESLERLGVGWSAKHDAWTFPMTDAQGDVLGIRLRLRNGRKLSVRGSKEGLFLPAGLEGGQQLLVAEGPTDTAALLDLGFAAVGRPSCTGGAAASGGASPAVQARPRWSSWPTATNRGGAGPNRWRPCCWSTRRQCGSSRRLTA